MFIYIYYIIYMHILTLQIRFHAPCGRGGAWRRAALSRTAQGRLAGGGQSGQTGGG